MRLENSCLKIRAKKTVTKNKFVTKKSENGKTQIEMPCLFFDSLEK